MAARHVGLTTSEVPKIKPNRPSLRCDKVPVCIISKMKDKMMKYSKMAGVVFQCAEPKLPIIGLVINMKKHKGPI